MADVTSPLKPPRGDVARIDRIRDNVGVERMYDALLPHLSTRKRLPVEDIAEALDTSVSTTRRLLHSLPLQDIGNLSSVGQRATLGTALEKPQEVVIPSIQHHRGCYLTNVESEALVKLIDSRAHNKQGIGMSSIRQFAADLRAQRLLLSRVALPSTTWYYDFKREWLDKDFRPLKSVAKDYKRANAGVGLILSSSSAS